MKRRSARGAIIAVLLLGLLIFGIVYYAWNTVTSIFQPVDAAGQGRVIPIQIRKGESTAQIADDLQAKGLIRNALAFRLWARIKGLDAQLQAGGYNHLNTSMTISDIIDQLLTASPDVIYVSIPEGYRIEQIAHAFAEAGLVRFNEQDFLKYALHPGQFPDAGKYPVLKLIPQGHSMEGLLFPATYDIPIDGNARDVMNRMLTTFNDNVQKNGLVAMAKAHGLPLADSGKNIATNSPWNTYIFKGLPPTPICSPGLATLLAAAAPAKSNYFYFFSTKSGSIVYATTYDEFLKKYNSTPH